MMSETRFKTQLKDKVDYNSRIYPFARSLYRTYCNFAGPFHILPDFIIFGVSRSGTTSLYQYLSQHPNIEPSVVKEPRFFDMYFDRGINWYRMNFHQNGKNLPLLILNTKNSSQVKHQVHIFKSLMHQNEFIILIQI